MIWKCFHRSGIWKCWGGLRGGQVHLKRGAALALVERPLLVVGLNQHGVLGSSGEYQGAGLSACPQNAFAL